MGGCETLKADKKPPKIKTQTNKGSPYYAAPMDKSNILSGPSNLTYSNITYSRDTSFQKAKLVKYCPKYADKSQRSIVKASLVELGQNSLMGNNYGNSTTNLTINNSIYCDDIIHEENENTEDSEVEVIYEGRVDENMINKTNEKNIRDNYNFYVRNNDIIDTRNLVKKESDLYKKK